MLEDGMHRSVTAMDGFLQSCAASSVQHAMVAFNDAEN
jgi:hypothetical protein